MKRMMYTDKESKEIEKLLSGEKNIIIRGANIKKFPYKMFNKGDELYLLESKEIAEIKSIVSDVYYF